MAAWQAAVERGAASAADMLAGMVHGFPAPSETPYLDLAFAGGTLADWGLDLSGARSLRWAGMERLIQAGVPARFAAELNAAGDLLTGQVDLRSDGSFTMGGPDARLLLVVRDECGVPAEVLAFRLDAPGEIACLLGGAGGGMLGRFGLASGSARVCLFATPLDWMRAGGRGLCVYDWPIAVAHLRQLGERVTLEAPAALASVLRARLQFGGLPLVANAVTENAKISLVERIGRAVA